MSSYQERQLLCGLDLTIQLPGVHNQPAKAGRMPQGHRPSTVDNLGKLSIDLLLYFVPSISDVSDSFIETLDQRKHRTV